MLREVLANESTYQKIIPINSHFPSPCDERISHVAQRTLNIFITEEVVFFRNSDDPEISSSGRFVLIKDGNTTLCSLNDRLSIPDEYDEITLTLQNGDEVIDITESLSPDFRRAVFHFLTKGRPHPYYCCVDFFLDTFGLYKMERTNHVNGEWLTEKFQEEFLKIGEGVYCSSHSADLSGTHFAVYLSNGLYIFVGGVSGSLIVANLAQMKEMYPSEGVFKLSLLNDSDKSCIYMSQSKSCL
jgi:hypothetical protein